MKKIVLGLLSLLAVSLLLMGCTQEAEQIEVVDEEGNIVGEASWYRQNVYKIKRPVVTLPEPTVEIKKNDFIWLNTVNELLQYKGADRNSATNPKIKFKRMGTSETLELPIANDQATIRLSGTQFKVKLLDPSAKDSSLQIDLDGDGALDTEPRLWNLYKR